MTTLPTTSSLRLPRGQGSGGPMVPPTQPPAGGPPGGAPALTPADIWRVIRGNLWLIVCVVVLAVGVGIGIYAYLYKNDPKFRSLGQLLVNRPYRVNPTNVQFGGELNDDFNLAIEQRTQQQQLVSEALWSSVIEKNTVVRNTDWFKRLQDKSARVGIDAVRLAKEDLEDNLRATPITDSKLISLTMDCASPNDAHDIVEAIGNAHIDNLRQATSDRNTRELNSATSYRDNYTAKARQTKERMVAVTNRTPGGTPADTGRLTIKEMEVSQLIGAQTKARLEATEAQGQLDGITNQIKNGKDPYQVDMMVRRDEQIMRLQITLDDLDVRIESQTLSGQKSPAVIALESARNASRAKLERTMSDVRGTARAQVVDSAQSEFNSKKAEEESINTQLDRLKAELGEISAARAEYASLSDEFESYKTLEREMTERVNILQNAARQQLASVSWSSLPTRPDTLSSPSLKVILPLSIILGLALSLGIAFLRELADTSVRSPRDITRVGPMNVLGMVARESDDPELTGVPLHTVISTAPQSLLAEQLRQVRTRLQHAVSLDTTRSILVTSAGPGDGKTTIACNLAAGLALNGRRILLVDANFHRPDLHKLYNVPNDAGFSNVLESVANLEGAVKKTPVANLELLTTGPRPANQTELLESPLFTDFIERALEEYDHVIFDAGPLLVVSEAVALAPRVDGVVTVVRAKTNTRGMLSRVKETLKQIKAEQIGVVLNGVQTWGGGYYARNIKTYYAYQSDT